MDVSVDVIERVSGVGKCEARRIKKFKTIEEEFEDRNDRGHPPVPLLQIIQEGRGNSKKYKVLSFGEANHPNEPRMQFMKDYFEDRILSILTKDEGDPSGVYRVQLHDSCSYLPRGDEFHDVLAFGRNKDANTALLADPYLVSGYANNMLGEPDVIPWASKASKVVFAGSTTGNMDPTQNIRVKACVWALDHPDETDFRITSVVQMNPFVAQRSFPQMKDTIAPHMSQHSQFRNQFVANIVGNTACWSRVPMILKSKSVMFHVPHDDVTWYSSLIKANEHYVACDTFEEFLTNRVKYTNLPMECARISCNANLLADTYMHTQIADVYTTSLLCSIEGA